MKKAHIVRFLKEGRRGIYKIIVEVYSDLITSSGVNLILELIQEDLERETGEKVTLNYFSLNRAITTHRKSGQSTALKPPTKKKYDFKDTHEGKKEEPPGRFKITD